MAKFNKPATRTAVTSPARSGPTPSGTTYEGAPGYARDTKSELFLLAVANMVGENTFYETADDRDNRFRDLVHQIAVTDVEWLAGFLLWLRREANMRSARVVAALEATKHVSTPATAATAGSWSRPYFSAPTNPANHSRTGTAIRRVIPKPVKRGIADAIQRLYTERSLLKYDTDSRGFRFGDVIDLVHPTPGDRQGDLYRHALDRRSPRVGGQGAGGDRTRPHAGAVRRRRGAARQAPRGPAEGRPEPAELRPLPLGQARTGRHPTRSVLGRWRAPVLLGSRRHRDHGEVPVTGRRFRFASRFGPPTITAAATYGTFWAATDAYVAAFLTVTLMAGYYLGWALHHPRNRIGLAELERIWRRNRISVADTEERIP